MTYNRACGSDCKAYADGECSVLLSLRQIAEGMRSLSAASGLYTQNAEAGWHK